MLTATCNAGSLDINATTRVDAAMLHAYTVDSVGAPDLTPANSVQAEPFASTDTVLVVDNDDDEIGQLAYANNNGSSVTVNWQIESSSFGACTVTGTALGG